MNGHKVIRLVRDLEGFLRKNIVDELPQLFNVLKGEMSLVGPRPVAAWGQACVIVVIEGKSSMTMQIISFS